jgi:ubiquinone/menaquinone biosynthesis C-methylase UbiE
MHGNQKTRPAALWGNATAAGAGGGPVSRRRSGEGNAKPAAGPPFPGPGSENDREATQSYFHGLAAEWDGRMGLDPDGASRLEAALDELDIRPGHFVVDAGCGTGVLYRFLEKRIGPEGRVLAVDLAAGMIAHARANYGGDSRFSWRAGEVAEVLHGLPPGSVDRIVCFSVFPHFADQPGTLRAFHRALRPPAANSAPRRDLAGDLGRFAIIHLRDSRELNRFHADLADTPVCRHLLPTAAELQVLATATGFRVAAARECPGLYLVVGVPAVSGSPTARESGRGVRPRRGR